MSRARESDNVEYDCLGIRTKDSNLGRECQKLVQKIEDSGLDKVEQGLGVSFSENERDFLRQAFTGNKTLAEEGDSNIARRLFGNLFISEHSAMQSKLNRLEEKTDLESKEFIDIFKDQNLLPYLTLHGKDK